MMANIRRCGKPMAVFRGLSRQPTTSQHSTRRGIAALIPPLDQFAPLDVVDLMDILNFKKYPRFISCHVGTKDGDFECTVEAALDVGPRAVKLVTPSGGYKYGVFVRNEKEKQIEYTGENDPL
jgi:hypothetical protein